MDQEKASARKRKRKPREENAGVGKRSRRRGAVAGSGEPQQQADAAPAPVAAVVQKVAECMQNEEEEHAGITEESMAEMMRWLALELATAPPLPAPGYVTVQGDVESCGPSFSRSASTVMASVDFRFVAPVPPVVQWPLPEPVPAPQQEEMVDDDWVATLLTDGPTGEGQY